MGQAEKIEKKYKSLRNQLLGEILIIVKENNVPGYEELLHEEDAHHHVSTDSLIKALKRLETEYRKKK